MKFVIDHDLHIHSRLSSCSGHPGQTPEAILNYARENGFRHICLTDHFWDDKVPGASPWYAPQNYAHLREALPLPTCDGIRFDFGCEAEMNVSLTVGIGRECLEAFDFIIVPTNHLHNREFAVPPDAVTVKRRAAYFMERNHALLDMDMPFEKMGLAHFTSVLTAYDSEGSRDEVFDAISDMQYAELFERVAAKGLGVELNTPYEDAFCESALRPYRIAKACGCKFYLGSDAHVPSDFLNARKRFSAIVDALGLTEDDKHPFVSR